MRPSQLTHPLVFAVLIALGGVAGEEGEAWAETPKACAMAAERAQSRRIEGKLVSARAELLACAKDECPAVVRRDCEGWLKEVDLSLPSIVVGARTADGKDVLEPRVFLDGVRLVDVVTGKALPLDPGVHELRVEHAGHRPAVERMVIREGEKNRLINVVVGAREPATEPPRVEAPAPANDVRHRPIPAAVYVTAGIGVAAFITAAVFGGLATARYDELEGSCGSTRSCSKDAIDGVNSRATVADIALVAGVVSTAAAAILFFTRPTVRSSAGLSPQTSASFLPGRF